MIVSQFVISTNFVNVYIKLDGNVNVYIQMTSGLLLRTHLADFLAAYNFARRLKTLGGLTPYEYVCKIWTSKPDRFILDPIHQMPGLNT